VRLQTLELRRERASRTNAGCFDMGKKRYSSSLNQEIERDRGFLPRRERRRRIGRGFSSKTLQRRRRLQARHAIRETKERNSRFETNRTNTIRSGQTVHLNGAERSEIKKKERGLVM